MTKITIPKVEYIKLKKQSRAYRAVATRLLELLIKDPIKTIVEDFRNVGLYSKEFLIDMENGLLKSSYGK